MAEPVIDVKKPEPTDPLTDIKSDNGKAKDRTYTAEDIESAKRGLIKELEKERKEKEELLAFKKQQDQTKLSAEEKFALTVKERDDAVAWKQQREAQDAIDLQEMEEERDALLKSFPRAVRDDNAEIFEPIAKFALKDQIKAYRRIKAKVDGQKPIAIHGATGGKPPEPESFEAERAKQAEKIRKSFGLKDGR